jgi:hypothetical protein
VGDAQEVMQIANIVLLAPCYLIVHAHIVVDPRRGALVVCACQLTETFLVIHLRTAEHQHLA